MKFKFTFILNIFLVINITVLMGCAGYHYVSSPQYVPLNDKKGELRANVSFNSLQAGYSITDNVGLFLTGGYGFNMKFLEDGGKEDGGNKSGTFRMYNFDIGTCFFKKSGLFNYELLTGIGGGEIHYQNKIDLWPDYVSEMDANKVNLFLQPDFGYKFRNIVEFGIFTKFIYTKYFNIKSSTIIGANSELDPDDQYFQNRTTTNLFFAEPGLLVRAGYKKIKFYTEWSAPLKLTNADIQYRPLNMNFGVSFSTDFFNRQD